MDKGKKYVSSLPHPFLFLLDIHLNHLFQLALHLVWPYNWILAPEIWVEVHSVTSRLAHKHCHMIPSLLLLTPADMLRRWGLKRKGRPSPSHWIVTWGRKEFLHIKPLPYWALMLQQPAHPDIRTIHCPYLRSWHLCQPSLQAGECRMAPGWNPGPSPLTYRVLRFTCLLDRTPALVWPILLAWTFRISLPQFDLHLNAVQSCAVALRGTSLYVQVCFPSLHPSPDLDSLPGCSVPSLTPDIQIGN